MKKFLWLLLLPTLAFAKWPASSNMQKDPVYIDVQPDQIVILPEHRAISATALSIPGNEFERFLDDLERVHTVRYSILVLRPGCVDLQRRVRQLLQNRNLDMGLEPVETGRYIPEVALNPDNYLSTTSHLSAAQAASVVEFFYSKRCPFEIEVRSNSLTILTNRVALASELRLFEVEASPNAPAILTNQMVVTREELDVAGNPFERYLDQYRAPKSQGPFSYRKEPGSDEFFAEVMKYSYEHGARKGVWDDVMSATPIEVPANGRAPVYLECRGDQLFAIADDAPAKEFEISGLKDLDPAAQYVCFLVRPDGFDIFRQARKAAWEHGLDVSCELQDESGPFAIGPKGKPLLSSTPESTAPIFSQKTQDLLARADAWMSKAETCSARPFISSNQSPVYIEVQPEQIVIYPEKTEIAAAGSDAPDGEFERFLAQFEAQRDTRTIVLLLRPGTAVFQRRLRQQIRAHGIYVGFGPIDELQALSPEGSPVARSTAVSHPETPAGLERIQVGSMEVLLSTPREMPLQKEPVYWECRQNQLFPISLAEMQAACAAKTEEIRKRTGNDENDFLRQAAQTTVVWNGQSIDFTYALMGRYVLSPVPEAQGMALENQVNALDPDVHRLHLYVRPNGQDISSQIQTLARERKIEVDVQLLDEKEYIFVGGANVRRD